MGYQKQIFRIEQFLDIKNVKEEWSRKYLIEFVNLHLIVKHIGELVKHLLKSRCHFNCHIAVLIVFHSNVMTCISVDLEIFFRMCTNQIQLDTDIICLDIRYTFEFCNVLQSSTNLFLYIKS